MKIPIRLEKRSVLQIRKFLKKNKRLLNAKQILKIQSIIEKESKINVEMAEKWFNSTLWKVALLRLRDLGKLKKVYLLSRWVYQYELIDALKAVKKVLNKYNLKYYNEK